MTLNPQEWTSEHFSYDEMTFTNKRLDNTPNAEQLERLINNSLMMERIRVTLGFAIMVTSAFRSNAVNKAVGGAETSAHKDGDATDFKCTKYGTPKAIVKRLVDSGIKFDQIIDEGHWVHISWAKKMRQQILYATWDSAGNVHYHVGLRP